MKAPAPLALLFDWPSRHNVHLALPVMLMIAVLLHVGGIFLFRATYPPVTRPEPRGAQVFFLRPGSPEAASAMPMIAARDPGLFSPSSSEERDIWKLPPTEYIPSFEKVRPVMEEFPEPPPLGLDRVWSPTPVAFPGTAQRTLPAPVEAAATRVIASDGLAARTFTLPETSAFTALTNQNLKPTSFLVGVSPEGVVKFTLPQASSGNELLDSQVLAALRKGRFSGDGHDRDAWGTITFYWGRDVSRQPLP